jgi:hypothetical protein
VIGTVDRRGYSLTKYELLYLCICEFEIYLHKMMQCLHDICFMDYSAKVCSVEYC